MHVHELCVTLGHVTNKKTLIQSAWCQLTTMGLPSSARTYASFKGPCQEGPLEIHSTQEVKCNSKPADMR